MLGLLPSFDSLDLDWMLGRSPPRCFLVPPHFPPPPPTGGFFPQLSCTPTSGLSHNNFFSGTCRGLFFLLPGFVVLSRDFPPLMFFATWHCPCPLGHCPPPPPVSFWKTHPPSFFFSQALFSFFRFVQFGNSFLPVTFVGTPWGT